MDRRGGIVLCGGSSRRMGRSKAWLRFKNEYFLTRIVNVVASVADSVVVAGREGLSLPPVPANVVRVNDLPDHHGPLAGMASGLAELGDTCRAVCVVACDHPFVSRQVLLRLFGRLNKSSATIINHDGRLLPLLAVYRVEVKSVVDQMMKEREWRAMELLKRIDAQEIAGHELRDVDPHLQSLININDQHDLDEAVKTMGGRP